jgi:hypothetical protein
MTDSDYLALHDQDLEDVMVEAERSSTPLARVLYNLAEGGHAYALNEKVLGPLRQKGKVFQRNIWASPVLTDLMSPLIAPDTNQVKEILLNDIANDSLDSFYPSRGSRSDDVLALSNLINNINNPRYLEPDSISFLRSPDLERIYQYTPDWHQDGILGMSQVTIAVTAGNHVVDMEFSDAYTHSTLIKGSKIWLACRPTSNNMAVLQAHYNTVLNDLENGTEYQALGVALDHARDYEAGIILIQRSGQTLLLPPFWMATAYSMQPTVSATFQIATAAEFEERIKQLGNFCLTLQLHLGDGNQADRGLFTFANELIENLRYILEDRFPECYLIQVIINICRGYETFRADLRRVLEAIKDKTIVQGLEDKWRAVWINFLEMKRKNTHKPVCRLCHLPIRDMPAGTSPMDRLRQHFIEYHDLRTQ